MEGVVIEQQGRVWFYEGSIGGMAMDGGLCLGTWGLQLAPTRDMGSTAGLTREHVPTAILTKGHGSTASLTWEHVSTAGDLDLHS